MASNGTGLLPGQSPPLSIITPTDHSGIVLIATAVSLAFSVISLLIRLFIRLEFRHSFGLDDIVAGLAMVFSVLQSSTLFWGASKGFGRAVLEIPSDDLVQVQKALYASDILYLVTLWLTKCSVSFLFLRLSPDKSHKLLSNMILLASTVLTVISIFIVALRCDLTRPWIFVDTQCTGLFARWQAVAAFDILTEVAIFSTSIHIVQGLQLSLRKKSVVILAFGLRLPVIAPLAMRLYYLGVEYSSSDPTLDGVMGSICTQIQLSYAIIAATTPCLRPFMTALSTNYGAPAKAKSSPSAPGTSRSGNNFSLASLTKTSRSAREDKGKSLQEPVTRWDQHEHNTSVMPGDQHSMESHESKQMIISKNTEWTVEFEGR